ncbi:hypothetical protein [Hirschia baltica]|uniref:CopG family transcriptional regulator n=1 Tax=Hirschia baltica (strain ATCC 49814 / DSM 5838 / IFAM 1418) TaxID=582402 RepID=C6XP85_HIRBI|nr:hypothetical protein [Hirschia baltica]ACT58371.1 conserved hypothetical protein [Hirschia baltica ATCC 49814]
MPKPRLNLRLSHSMHNKLKEMSTRPGVAINEIVEDALNGYFDPLGANTHATTLAKRIERLESLSGRLERDLAISSETMALFVQYWLTATPPLPEIDRDAAHALGRKRFDRFMGQVAERVSRP